MMKGERPPLAMTMGDPAGIGPELALAAWRLRAIADAPFFVLASPARLAETAQRLGWAAPIVETDPENAASVIDRGLPVAPLDNPVAAEPGRPDAANAAATLESIERAVTAVRTGAARAVVTNPIAKATLYEAGFRFPGHTEYLGALAAAWGEPAFPVMMIWSEALAVVPVTIHIALAEAPRRADPGAHRRDGAGGRPRPQGAVPPRSAAHRRRGPQSPCRGRRRDGARGDHDHRAGDRGAARRRASTRSARCPPTRCFTPRLARVTTSR